MKLVNAFATTNWGAGLFLLSAVTFSTASLAQSAIDQQKVVGGSYADILERASSASGAEVLVTLDVPLHNEGSQGAVEQQARRESIASAQSKLVVELQSVNAHVLTAYSSFPIVHLGVDRAALQRLLTLPEVRYVQENGYDRAQDNASNAVINVAAAWAAGYDGAGWTVVIMDTGMQENHPFLGGRVVAEACFSTTNASLNALSVCPNGQSTSGGNPAQVGAGSGVNCASGTYGCEHGTNMAGIAAGANNGGVPGYDGVGRGASIISLQIFSQFTDAASTNPPNICTASGLTSPCSLSLSSDQLAALQYTLATLVPTPGLKIASISLGVGGGSPQAAVCDTDARKAPIDGLRAAGVATVIAAGNNSSTVGLTAPACISSAISVGTTDDLDVVQSFSNRASYMSLFAPGVNLNTATLGSSFAPVTGTSPSTAQVAGAWTILKEKRPTATVTEILTAFQNTGRPITTNGFTKARIDVGAALIFLEPPTLQGAASRKVHGGAGTFNLPLGP